MSSNLLVRKILPKLTNSILRQKQSFSPILINKVMGSTSNHDFDVYTEQTKPEYKQKFNEAELKNRLTPMQFHVTQEKGTERPFSGTYLKEKREGVFACVVCDDELFDSSTKFDSGCGWPSFYDVKNLNKVLFIEDKSHGMRRIEVQCANCGAHMGHVFDDGPQPTNLRYCINSASIKFNKKN